MNPCGFEFPDGGGCHLTERNAGVADALDMSREVLTCHSSRQRNGPVKSDVNWNVQRPSVRPAAACWQSTREPHASTNWVDC